MCGGITKDDKEVKVVTREKGAGWRLRKAEEAPKHCVSPAILTGYRCIIMIVIIVINIHVSLIIFTEYRPALTYVACLRSILRIHNETVNIW